MIENNIGLLKNRCEFFDVFLNDRQIEQFIKYYDLLVEWNSFMNLTGITEYEEVVQKHFVDSLSLTKAVDMTKEEIRLIDIGTGAGFPGIPLKIAFPHLKVILLDSLKKRVNFLNKVIEEIGLNNIKALHGRAEDFAKEPLYRQQFDLCVSRAVSNLSSLAEYCLPYVKVNGKFISYKGIDSKQEVNDAKNAIFLLGGKKKEVIEFKLPDSNMDRALIVIDKLRETPGKFPRKAGLPTKEPLK